jgi:hypothetical protein
MRHQYKQIRLAKETLAAGEVMLHVDFSENYQEKFGNEVQASHFGSRGQIVLHQGVLYSKVMTNYSIC